MAACTLPLVKGSTVSMLDRRRDVLVTEEMVF